MRTSAGLVGLLLSLSLAGSAQAQSTAFGGSTGPIQYQVITTDNPAAPIASPQLVSQNDSPNRFFRSSTGRISNQPVYGSSVFPTDAEMPGDAYLSAFHIKRYSRVPPSVWFKPWTWFN